MPSPSPRLTPSPATSPWNPLQALDRRRSCDAYLGVVQGRLVPVLNPQQPCSEDAQGLHARFRDQVLTQGFPCVAARSVVNRTTYRMSLCGELGSAESAQALCHDLYEFGHEFLAKGAEPGPPSFVSFIAMFRTPHIRSEAQFEQLLWQQLQAMHDIDARYFPWDPTVSPHPDDESFSYSIGGRAYFVVGLHPRASRKARVADQACIVFNPHVQFEQLRAQGKFAPLQQAIRERDLAFQGSVNPMLSDHGQQSESLQYSGRAVPAHWRCPFHHQDAS